MTMAESKDRYVLRFLSGPHAGAEAVVNDGAYVLGNGADSDLVIQDPGIAARHLLLELRSGRMTAESLDAAFFLDGEEVGQGRVTLAPFQVLTAGATSMALARYGDPWPEPAIPPLRTDAGLTGKEAEDAALPGPEKNPEDHAAPPPDDQDDEPDSRSVMPPGFLARLPRWAWLAGPPLIVAAVFWLGTVLITPSAVEDRAPTEPWTDLLGVLDELNLEQVRAERKAGGRFIVNGLVATDAQQRALRLALRDLPFPVSLRVVVMERRIRAVEEVLRILGLRHQVEDLGQGRLRLSGYVRDEAVLARLEEQLASDVPGLDDVLMKVVRYVEVHAALVQHMRHEGLLGLVQLEPHAGWITAGGALDPQQRRAWGRVKDAVEQEMEAPIVFQEEFTFPPLAPAAAAPDPRETRPAKASSSAGSGSGLPPNKATNREEARPPRIFPLPIRGISLVPIPFVLTADGERVFSGARLPDGGIVESIGLRGIVVLRQGQRIIYPTGGL